MSITTIEQVRKHVLSPLSGRYEKTPNEVIIGDYYRNAVHVPVENLQSAVQRIGDRRKAGWFPR
ncbi:MAG: hypothetical protein AAGG72_04120, partial [Pseudomonadota bacterium]